MKKRGQVTGGAASVYEELFVPALFAEWAPRVADAASVERGHAPVLDVACGTGVLARELGRRVGHRAVVGLDLNEGMLAVARDLEPRIEWRRGRAEELPFEDEQFDAVVSQFGLMFFEDRAGALREMWRVLRPGGALAVAVWGPLEQTPGYAAMVRLLGRLFGDTVADELRAPFVLGDVSELGALITEAGVPDARIETVVGSARFASIEAWVASDIRGWTLADVIDDEQHQVLLEEAQRSLHDLAPDGPVRFDSPAHVASARKPSV